MHRIVSYRYTEVIEATLPALPNSLRPLLSNVDYLTGTDPVYAGLHPYTTTEQGDAYKSVFHTVYPFNQLVPKSRRRITIVLPIVPTPWILIHEWGHVLHEYYGFLPNTKPVTEYAKTDRYEAFAEAFMTWFEVGWQSKLFDDPQTVQLFEAW